MIGWISLFALVLLVGLLVFGWLRGWSMLLTLVITMGAVFILGLASASGRLGSIGGSPLLIELAWRPEYMTLGAWPHWWTAITSMFLHADVRHFLVNVVVFAFIGMGFEDRVGRGRFLLVFLLSGLLGTLLHSAINLDTFSRGIPLVGASGAVFGIIGAYATMYPRDRVVLFLFLIIPNVPVYIAGLLYTAVELVALELGGTSNVARFAHFGGLIMGVLVGLALQRSGVPDVEARRATASPAVDADRLAELAETEEQKRLLERFRQNQDVPELATAWLEKFARSTPCPSCGQPLEATRGSLRSACGWRLDVRAKKQKE